MAEVILHIRWWKTNTTISTSRYQAKAYEEFSSHSPSHPFPTPRRALHSLQPFISQHHSNQFPQHPDDAPHHVLPASSCAPPIQSHQSQPLRLLRTSTTSSFHQNPLHFRHHVHFPFSFDIQCFRYYISVILFTANTPPLDSRAFEDPLLPILRKEKRLHPQYPHAFNPYEKQYSFLLPQRTWRGPWNAQNAPQFTKLGTKQTESTPSKRRRWATQEKQGNSQPLRWAFRSVWMKP